MLKVGLTGGIGSGKSIVGKIFKQLGIPVFNADKEAKAILNNNQEVIAALKNIFGEHIYTNQAIDRKKLASIIFNDIEALNKVNAIIHPKVHEYFNQWILKQSNAPYVIEEAAILFESDAYKFMDITINVHANELIRIKRVMERDGTTHDLTENRIKHQMSDQERIERSDYTIYNENDQMVLPQILEIHHQIMKKKNS